jgi:hypothetical protein
VMRLNVRRGDLAPFKIHPDKICAQLLTHRLAVRWRSEHLKTFAGSSLTSSRSRKIRLLSQTGRACELPFYARLSSVLTDSTIAISSVTIASASR